MENQTQKQKLIKIAGLWKNDTGTAIKSAKFADAVTIEPGMRLIVLPNKKKEQEKHPDYAAFLAPVEGEQQAKAPQFSDEIPF